MKTNIHEYCEEMEVEINRLEPRNEESYSGMGKDQLQAHAERRWVVKAFNEGGGNFTEVDLVELLRFVKKKMPELWRRTVVEETEGDRRRHSRSYQLQGRPLEREANRRDDEGRGRRGGEGAKGTMCWKA